LGKHPIGLQPPAPGWSCISMGSCLRLFEEAANRRSRARKEPGHTYAGRPALSSASRRVSRSLAFR
jgi:hypothetical protein